MNHTRPPCLVDVDAATQLYPNSESKLKKSIDFSQANQEERTMNSVFIWYVAADGLRQLNATQIQHSSEIWLWLVASLFYNNKVARLCES